MAIEWGFLILLAVGAGVADLRPGFIILIMTIGWILVVLVELLAWRARPRYTVSEAAVEGPGPVETPPPSLPPPLSPVEQLPPPPAAEQPPPPAYDFEFQGPAPEQPPPEEQTAVVSAVPVEEPEPRELDAEHPYAPAPERERLQEADQRAIYRLDPLQPRPRRKYRWFGPYLAREEATTREESPASAEESPASAEKSPK